MSFIGCKSFDVPLGPEWTLQIFQKGLTIKLENWGIFFKSTFLMFIENQLNAHSNRAFATIFTDFCPINVQNFTFVSVAVCEF